MGNPSPDIVTVCATCFGVSIGVRCRSVDQKAVSSHLPLNSERVSSLAAEHVFSLEPHSEDETLFSIRRGSSLRASRQPLNSALKTLQKQLHICIAEHATSHAFVHAGVLAWKNRAVIFPGFSHAGKSTLVWSLVQAGAVYYSDEYAVFDESGYVCPFALPISLRLNHGERAIIMPDRTGSSPLQADLIVFTRYRPGAVWRPRPLGPAETMLQLIRHSIAIRRNPSLVLPVLKKISLQTRSQSFLGRRGDSLQLLQWLAGGSKRGDLCYTSDTGITDRSNEEVIKNDGKSS